MEATIEHTEPRDRANREELVERIASALPHDGTLEPLPGLHLARMSQLAERIHGVSRPSFCVIAQGAKDVYLGDSRFHYDALHYLLATVELPITGSVVQASADRPYLSVRLELDQALVASVMVEAGLPAPRSPSDARAIAVSPLDPDLLDATVRMARLLASPDQARILLPLVSREIIYRLLTGEQGNRLRHLPAFGGQATSIAGALQLLRRDFDRPLRVNSLAREVGMSPSGLHHHFKAVTGMSPLQFQKQLRLQEARRLMLGENLDAASAGFRVGYYDASHFSRDYKKHFGEPPARDVDRLRADLSASPAASAAQP